VNAIRLHLPAGASGPAADRSYDIICGRNLLDSMGERLRASGGVRAVVIADAAVVHTHAARVVQGLRTAGIEAPVLEVPSGEASKCLAEAGRLWDACAGLAVDRRTQVVAVGGGVTGDLAGFVAATFGRGLPVWHVPTTLVAQVDSAIGGKTGINLDVGKNLVGVFWQPVGVVSDIDTLATLPDREYLSGLAEVVKYGMILDADFFVWLEKNANSLVHRDPAAVAHAVSRSAAIKAMVVERDERETTGLRAALNYGHTFAHAYETVSGYGTLLHGEAVAIGMARAARLAAQLGRISGELVARQDQLLRAMLLPVDPAASLRDAQPLIAVMARDKKTVNGQLRFVLPSEIGHVDLVDGNDEIDVRSVLEA
jgi:3-dehydroquinate synthase